MQLLIISGPTACGKTALAAQIAQQFNGELISADSRQVYKQMDIVTGKDRPENTTIHGLDLAEPDQSFDVSSLTDYAHKTIQQITQAGRLPILVGGTGFYLNAIINPPETIGIPINQNLRHQLEQKTVVELQTQLQIIDPDRYLRMNHSDVNNPRRLVRAIEVAHKNQSIQNQPTPKISREKYHILHLHLTAPINQIADRIRKRVIQRINQGAIKETQQLLEKYSPNLTSMSALGYQEIIKHLNHQLTISELVAVWSLHELQYAKRQLTWFKKQPNLTLIDTTNKNYLDISTKNVRKWRYAKN